MPLTPYYEKTMTVFFQPAESLQGTTPMLMMQLRRHYVRSCVKFLHSRENQGSQHGRIELQQMLV